MINKFTYTITVLIIFSSCMPNDNASENYFFEKRGLEFCIAGIEDAKERYLKDTIIELDFGYLSNKESKAYSLILRTYSHRLETYGVVPHQYYRNVDSIMIHRDTFAYYDYCYKQFIDGMIEKEYGSTFYSDVKNKADSLIQKETFDKIERMYWEFYKDN